MANLKKASDQLFNRSPDERYESLSALQDYCSSMRDRSQDFWQPPRDIVAATDGSDVKIQIGTDGAFLLNDWSFSQVCGLARVQKATLNRLQPQTAVQVLQETLPRSNRPIQLLTAGDQVRSIHGVSYSRLWNADVVEMVREYDDFQPPPKGFNGATGLYAGEQDMFTFCIDPNGWIDINGDQFAPGFFVWNSEVGRRSVGIQTFWYQRICSNHIVWDATEVLEFTRKHTGDVGEALTEVRRLIEQLIERRDERKDGFARAVMAAADVKLGSDSDEVKKALAKQGVSAGLTKRALERTSSPGPYTLWQMVDALTQLSRELPNAGDRFDADQKASQLLSLAS